MGENPACGGRGFIEDDDEDEDYDEAEENNAD
jgi:hypothetical protein